MDKFSGEPEISDELIFGFTEEFVGESSWSSSSSSAVDFVDETEQDENSSTLEEESKAFWESQEDLLMTTLFRTTSMESKLRQATKEVMKEMNLGAFRCVCDKMAGNMISCRNCMQTEICSRLQMAGHNCTIFKSKWRKSSEIPSGEHTYMEVVSNPSSLKGGDAKIIIELNFRGQFEMARGCEEYRRLIGKLPEVFVGKFGRLQNLVKILCAALKKSFKERQMHIAPWRKHKYMVAKWQGSPDQIQILAPNNQRSARPIASMLTFALLDSLQVIPRSAMIQVL